MPLAILRKLQEIIIFPLPCERSTFENETMQFPMLAGYTGQRKKSPLFRSMFMFLVALAMETRQWIGAAVAADGFGMNEHIRPLNRCGKLHLCSVWMMPFTLSFLITKGIIYSSLSKWVSAYLRIDHRRQCVGYNCITILIMIMHNNTRHKQHAVVMGYERFNCDYVSDCRVRFRTHQSDTEPPLAFTLRSNYRAGGEHEIEMFDAIKPNQD